MTELTRVVFADCGSAEAKLATEAAKELGYGVMAKAFLVAGELGTALRKLDIKPFSDASVTTYKREMAAKFTSEARAVERRVMQIVRRNDGLLCDIGLRKQIPIPEDEKQWIHNYPKAEWHLIGIASYGQPIPEFVINKALQIKRECPNVMLSVDSLIVGSIPKDPFLVAQLGSEAYYVEVWDEPKFESAL